jgi:proteasome assembly chaperone (PAC2) family protein
MKDFEEWWATEPFGFDHPDTKAGIKKLLQVRDEQIQALESKFDKAEKEVDRAIRMISHHIFAVGGKNVGSLHSALKILKGELNNHTGESTEIKEHSPIKEIK